MQIGFLHIPRTGGTYFSSRLGLGFFAPSNQRMVSKSMPDPWHHVPKKRSRRIYVTIIRNPYDRIMSELKYANLQISDLESLEIPTGGHFCLQKTLAEHADVALRYEHLNGDATNFLNCIGIYDVDFSDFSPRKKKPLGKHEKEIIYEKYRDDFVFLGYDP